MINYEVHIIEPHCSSCLIRACVCVSHDSIYLYTQTRRTFSLSSEEFDREHRRQQDKYTRKALPEQTQTRQSRAVRSRVYLPLCMRESTSPHHQYRADSPTVCCATTTWFDVIRQNQRIRHRVPNAQCVALNTWNIRAVNPRSFVPRSRLGWTESIADCRPVVSVAVKIE